MVPLNVAIPAITFLIGCAITYGVMEGVMERDQLKRDKEAVEQAYKQEKRNAEITAEHVRDVQTIHLHYQHNPVRVFIPRRAGESGSTTCPDVSASDIVLTVGGIKRSDGTKTD